MKMADEGHISAFIRLEIVSLCLFFSSLSAHFRPIWDSRAKEREGEGTQGSRKIEQGERKVGKVGERGSEGPFEMFSSRP